MASTSNYEGKNQMKNSTRKQGGKEPARASALQLRATPAPNEGPVAHYLTNGTLVIGNEVSAKLGLEHLSQCVFLECNESNRPVEGDYVLVALKDSPHWHLLAQVQFNGLLRIDAL